MARRQHNKAAPKQVHVAVVTQHRLKKKEETKKIKRNETEIKGKGNMKQYTNSTKQILRLTKFDNNVPVIWKHDPEINTDSEVDKD